MDQLLDRVADGDDHFQTIFLANSGKSGSCGLLESVKTVASSPGNEAIKTDTVPWVQAGCISLLYNTMAKSNCSSGYLLESNTENISKYLLLVLACNGNRYELFFFLCAL